MPGILVSKERNPEACRKTAGTTYLGRGPLGAGRRMAGPADGLRRQPRRADHEHRDQQGRQPGRDLVGAPPQRVTVQAQPAR
jgi:hypothetical protein